MSQAPANSRPLPEPVLSVEETLRRRELLLQYIDTGMKRGEDYGGVEGRSGSYTLLKPGAEKILAFFGLSPQVEVTHRVENWTPTPPAKPFVSYEVKVTLIDKRSKTPWGEGLGSCNSQERKYKNQDAANIANTILKMAKKRAILDAATQATATSGLFASGDPGEDLDYEPSEHPQKQQRPQQQARAQQRPQQQRPQQQRRPEPYTETAPQPTGPVLLVTAEQLYEYNQLRDRALEQGLDVPGTLSMSSKASTFKARMQMLEDILANDAEGALLAAAAKDAQPAGGVKYSIPKNATSRPCSSCQAQIWFVSSGKAGFMPVDQDGTPHFATCPNAGQHRRPRNAAPTQQQGPAPQGSAQQQPAQQSTTRPDREARRQASNSNLPRHVAYLWKVIGDCGLPAAVSGRERDARLDTCNAVLMDHNLDPVNSFNELTKPAAKLLADMIEGGHIREWKSKAVAA